MRSTEGITNGCVMSLNRNERVRSRFVGRWDRDLLVKMMRRKVERSV